MAAQKPLFGGASPKKLPWEPLPNMAEWLANLEAQEVSASYLKNSQVAMSHFATFAKGAGILVPDDITRSHVIQYQQSLLTATKDDGTLLYAPSYRQRLMKDLGAWLGWLFDLGYIETSPWVRIKVGATPKKPKPLEDEEIAALFAAHKHQAFSIDPFWYHRREVILTLLFAWGLRIHELQALNLANMDMRLEWGVARNKGGGTKPLPYGDEIKQVVQRYLVHRAKYAKFSEDALLIDQTGGRQSIQMIRKIITELGDTAGIPVNPHRLRDTFGTTMLDNDVEVERIMKMMGHTQRAQTLAYARVNDHKVKESHDRVMNPMLRELLG